MINPDFSTAELAAIRPPVPRPFVLALLAILTVTLLSVGASAMSHGLECVELHNRLASYPTQLFKKKSRLLYGMRHEHGGIYGACTETHDDPGTQGMLRCLDRVPAKDTRELQACVLEASNPLLAKALPTSPPPM